MKGRSSLTNLLEFTNQAIKAVESGEPIDVVYTNVRKSFNRISHKILLKKLSLMGVHSAPQNWI